MPDQPLPKPEGVFPGQPKPPFPTEVVLSGSSPSSQSITPGRPSSSGEKSKSSPSGQGDHPPHSETEMFFRWLAGMLLLLVFGWGFIALFAYLSRTLHLGVSLQVAAAIAAVFSLMFMFLLEKDLWLSKFLGLRLGPHATPLSEAVYFWILGIPGLLLCSTAAEKPAGGANKPGETDGTREIVETVVFVVVLVLLLKTFLAEAFVIPTGSMADTLLGYHKEVHCEQCGYPFLINCSSEVDPQPGHDAQPVIGGFCPNCRFFNDLQPPLPEGKDP